MNWFTQGTQSAGTGISNLLSGFLDPASKALGSNTTVETTTPNTSNSKTGTMVIAALAVITLIVVGIIIFKKSS